MRILRPVQAQLGTPWYDTAKAIVEHLSSGRVDEAIAAITVLEPNDAHEVSRRLIALGVAPETVAELMAFAQGGEVIEIHDRGPRIPWGKIALFVGVVGGGGILAYYLTRRSI